MRAILVALLALSLFGCTTPKLGMGTEAGGIVSNYGWAPNKSLAIANTHCAKYGKAARVTSQNDLQNNMTFDCVAK